MHLLKMFEIILFNKYLIDNIVVFQCVHASSNDYINEYICQTLRPRIPLNKPKDRKDAAKKKHYA